MLLDDRWRLRSSEVFGFYFRQLRRGSRASGFNFEVRSLCDGMNWRSLRMESGSRTDDCARDSFGFFILHPRPVHTSIYLLYTSVCARGPHASAL